MRRAAARIVMRMQASGRSHGSAGALPALGRDGYGPTRGFTTATSLRAEALAKAGRGCLSYRPQGRHGCAAPPQHQDCRCCLMRPGSDPGGPTPDYLRTRRKGQRLFQGIPVRRIAEHSIFPQPLGMTVNEGEVGAVVVARHHMEADTVGAHVTATAVRV